jgi:methylenetetrahydrofolate reductase (NADPH)
LDKRPIQDLVKGYSIETTVRESLRIERYADIVPRGTKLYIAHVPGTSPDDTVALAGRLRKEGMEPVPHIVARRIESAAALDSLLAQLVGQAGVSQVLVVAGDIDAPTGQLESGLQILDSGLLEKHGIRKIGVAGHPEGHRAVSEPVLRQALVKKNEYARRTGADLYVVTQFAFAAEPFIAWEAANGPDVNRLPYIAGLPGLATIKTLLKYALDCGVGPSLSAISKHAANLTKLLSVQTPDDVLVGLAAHKAKNPGSLLSGLHFFPFGGLKRTADWLAKINEGRFDLTKDESGLTVTS